MKVSALTHQELASRLRHAGLFLQTGPYVIHVQTVLPGVAENIALLYADYSLIESCAFADFHVSLALPRTVRRWFKPQVLFLFDGDPAFKPLPRDQAFAMLEWGLNWCVSSHVNDHLIIHAAVVEKNGQAIILPAPPGSGKSTLCAALVNRGWRLLSDELALIRTSDGRITPLPRPVSLKNQSIAIMQRFAPDARFSQPVHDTQKGTVAHMQAPTDSIARAQEPARPARIIFPKYQPDAATQFNAVSKSRAFMRVADNAFNYSLLGVLGFETTANLIDACLCHDFTYSDLDAAVATFDTLSSSHV